MSPTDDMRWVKIAATGDVPGGRASHSSAVFRDHVYIFGGIGPEGTLDTTYKYHTGRETSASAGELGTRFPLSCRALASRWSGTSTGLACSC